jgi:iron complex outermembrane receptor protein/hemoglobin/transferrin/lactoferrin receptor protein
MKTDRTLLRDRPRRAARRLWVAALVGLPLLLASAAAAQTTNRGSIAGTVRSDAGEALSYADVHLVRLGLNTRTDDDGSFRFPAVPAGEHTLRVERLGFRTVVVTVSVREGSETRADFTLERSPFDLEELVVTATAGARDPLTTPQSVAVVSNQSLQERRSGSVGALLADQIPGVFDLSTGPANGIPVIRGLSGTRVRMMQNGVGQEFYQYGVRHAAPTSLGEAERVEVVRGVSSLLYGSDALGGAINVLTRDLPTAPEGRTHFGGQVEADFASMNDERSGLLDVHVARGRFGARAGFELRDAGNLTTPGAPTFFDPNPATGRFGDPKYAGELPFTNYEQRSGYLQAGVRGDFGRVEVFGNFWQSDQNFLLPPGGPVGSTSNPPLGVGIELGNVQLSAKGSIVAGSTVIRPIVSFQRNTRQAADEGITFEDATEFAIDLEKDVVTTRVEVGHRDGLGTLGAEYQRVEGRLNGRVALEPGSRVDNVALFGLQEFQLGSTLLSVGGRADFRRQEADPNGRTTDPDLLEQNYFVLSGSLGLSRPLAESVTLALNVGTGFRAPTIFEMFANGVHGGVAAFQRGNPELEAERAVSGDVALRYRSDRVQGEVSAYVQGISNYIFLANTGEETGTGLPILEADQADALLRGAEGLIEVAATNWLGLGGSFAVVEGTSDDLSASPSGNADGDLPLLPENRFGAFLEFRRSALGPARSTALRLGVDRFLDKDAAGRIEPFSQFDGIPFGTASTEAYTLLSLEGRGVLELGTVPLSVTLIVDNLLDEVYRGFLDTYKGYALSPGRNVRVRFSAPLSLNR